MGLKKKRDKETITLGSGKVYLATFTDDSMPTSTDLCVTDNQLGHIKGGATLTYAQETYEEKDDLGLVQKVITTSEKVTLGLGLITWNGATLKKLIDRCQTTEANGIRTTKIGGAGNSQGEGFYAIAFQQKDAVDGDLTVIIKGKNTAGATLAFAKDAGTTLNPEFTALPQDDNGTLVVIEEEIPTTT